MNRIITLFITFLFVHFLAGQQISLLNPDFEGTTGHSTLPDHWINCGPPEESPPDILPGPTFRVTKEAYSGNTYVGMVTRDNGTWELMSAELSGVLEYGKCYRFRIALAQSSRYHSMSRKTGEPANFIAPTRLRIWGGTTYCEGGELLAESPTVTSEEWQIYTFILRPMSGSYSTITLEAGYMDKDGWPANGNILLDGASAFVLLENCQLDGFTMPELEAEQTSAVNLEPAVLALPDEDYFKSEETLRFYLSNVLQDVVFGSDNKLLENSYFLDGNENLQTGNPALFAFQHALQFYPDKQWELVVFGTHTEDMLSRLFSVTTGLGSQEGVDLKVTAYDASIHDGQDWCCMSIANGLYLREIPE